MTGEWNPIYNFMAIEQIFGLVILALLTLMILKDHLYIQVTRYGYFGSQPKPRAGLRYFSNERMRGLYGKFTRNYQLTLGWRRLQLIGKL